MSLDEQKRNYENDYVALLGYLVKSSLVCLREQSERAEISEAKMEAFFESSAACMMFLNPKGELLNFNNSVANFGYFGKTVQEFRKHADSLFRAKVTGNSAAKWSV